MDEKYYTCIPVYVRNYLKDNCSNKFIPSNESICTSFPSCSSLYLTHIYLRMYDNVKERVNWIKWSTKLRCHFIYLVYYFSLSLFFFLSKWWHNDDHFILIHDCPLPLEISPSYLSISSCKHIFSNQWKLCSETNIRHNWHLEVTWSENRENGSKVRKPNLVEMPLLKRIVSGSTLIW